MPRVKYYVRLVFISMVVAYQLKLRRSWMMKQENDPKHKLVLCKSIKHNAFRENPSSGVASQSPELNTAETLKESRAHLTSKHMVELKQFSEEE